MNIQIIYFLFSILMTILILCRINDALEHKKQKQKKILPITACSKGIETSSSLNKGKNTSRNEEIPNLNLDFQSVSLFFTINTFEFYGYIGGLLKLESRLCGFHMYSKNYSSGVSSVHICTMK